jgi:hypothetical protein
MNGFPCPCSSIGLDPFNALKVAVLPNLAFLIITSSQRGLVSSCSLRSFLILRLTDDERNAGRVKAGRVNATAKGSSPEAVHARIATVAPMEVAKGALHALISIPSSSPSPAAKTYSILSRCPWPKHSSQPPPLSEIMNH